MVQLRLAEREYQDAFPEFRRVLSDTSAIAEAPTLFPLSFARLLTELASRTFVPRSSGSPLGTGLWQNLREEVPHAVSERLIGQAFEQSLAALRRRFPELAFHSATGWRYLSNILIHSGIPVRTVPYVVAALSAYIPDGDKWASKIDATRIEEALNRQSGLNKYTISVLAHTPEGIQLVQQLLRLCYFIRNGGVPQTAVFSKPFVVAVQEALKGKVRDAELVHKEQKEPFFVFDDFEGFIGWVVPTFATATASFTVRRLGRSETVEPVELSTGRQGISVLPESTLLVFHLRKANPATRTFRFIPRGMMLFDSRTGLALDAEKGIPKEISSGEYLLLADRLEQVSVEERFQPADRARITEEGIPLPPGWESRYQGFRVYLVPTDQLRVMVGKSEWVSISVRGFGKLRSGYVSLHGDGATYLNAFHPAVPYQRIPIFTGGDLPSLHFWGERFSQSCPEVRIARWTSRGWRPLRNVIAHPHYFSDGASIVLTGKGIDDLLKPGQPGMYLLRLDLYDLSLYPVDIEPIYLIWLPKAAFFSQVGLLSHQKPAYLRIQLDGQWTAASSVGTVRCDTVHGKTTIRHRLPFGARRALLKLRQHGTADAGLTIIWNSPGTIAGALASKSPSLSERTQLPKVGLPLGDISQTAVDQWERVDLEWWPLVRAEVSLLHEDTIRLGQIFFDREGRGSLHLLPIWPVLRDSCQTADGLTLCLRIADLYWTLFRYMPDVALATNDQLRIPRSELSRLLWEAEVMASGGPKIVGTRREAYLLAQLRNLRPSSPAVRFLVERLNKALQQI